MITLKTLRFAVMQIRSLLAGCLIAQAVEIVWGDHPLRRIDNEGAFRSQSAVVVDFLEVK